MSTIQTPQASELVPPLLGCLAFAFVSNRPPPALLDLVTPLLKQRLQYLTDADSGGPAEWLNLLSWDTSNGAKLRSALENAVFEAHPASGEIELGDIPEPLFCRLDQDSFQSLIRVSAFSIQIVYQWTKVSTEKNQWLVAEVLSDEGVTSVPSSLWFNSIAEAEVGTNIRANEPSRKALSNVQSQSALSDMTDDGYWSRYDASRQGSEHNIHAARQNFREPSTLETILSRSVNEDNDDDYYRQYDSVQPALDPDSPEEQSPGQPREPDNEGVQAMRQFLQTKFKSGTFGESPETNAEIGDSKNEILQPQYLPRMVDVAQLDQFDASSGDDHLALEQHIGDSIESLQRLAIASGMNSSQFKYLMQKKLNQMD